MLFHMKTRVSPIYFAIYCRLESLFDKVGVLRTCNLSEEDSNTDVSCELYKLFSNNFFEEHLWTSVSKHYLKRDSNTTQNTRTKHRAKSFILQETKDSRLLTKTALKRTSNAIFNMKMVGLDESWLNRETKSNTTFRRKQLC